MQARFLLATGAALALITACSRDDREDVALTNDVNVATDTTNMETNAVAMAPTAADFTAAVAASDLYEIESGKLAAEKAASAEVKSFAQMLVAEHQKSTADLKSAAAKASSAISVAPALDAEKQGLMDSLKGSAEGSFDQTFVAQQKQAHQKALDLLRQYETSGDDQALKDFASKAAPVVQSHLDKLNGLRP